MYVLKAKQIIETRHTHANTLFNNLSKNPSILLHEIFFQGLRFMKDFLLDLLNLNQDLFHFFLDLG
jgi:hypothetical protein